MIVVGLFRLKIGGGQQFSNIIAITLKGQQLVVFHKSTILTSSPALARGHMGKAAYRAFKSFLFDNIIPSFAVFFLKVS